MRRPTEEELREFAYATGARSRNYQSLPFATQNDLECVVVRSEFLNEKQKKICVKWLKAAHSLPISWVQARFNHEWEESIQNENPETWEITDLENAKNNTKLHEISRTSNIRNVQTR